MSLFAPCASHRCDCTSSVPFLNSCVDRRNRAYLGYKACSPILNWTLVCALRLLMLTSQCWRSMSTLGGPTYCVEGFRRMVLNHRANLIGGTKSSVAIPLASCLVHAWELRSQSLTSCSDHLLFRLSSVISPQPSYMCYWCCRGVLPATQWHTIASYWSAFIHQESSL
jgi:hypothetical protein